MPAPSSCRSWASASACSSPASKRRAGSGWKVPRRPSSAPGAHPIVGLMTWSGAGGALQRRDRRQSRRHDAAKRLSVRADAGQPGVLVYGGAEAISASATGTATRSTSTTVRPWRRRPGLLRHVAGRTSARDGRAARASVVRRGPVPSGAEVAPFAPHPPVRRLHPGGRRAVEADDDRHTVRVGKVEIANRLPLALIAVGPAPSRISITR